MIANGEGDCLLCLLACIQQWWSVGRAPKPPTALLGRLMRLRLGQTARFLIVAICCLLTIACSLALLACFCRGPIIRDRRAALPTAAVDSNAQEAHSRCDASRVCALLLARHSKRLRFCSVKSHQVARQVRLGPPFGPWYRSVKTCFQRTNKYSAILMTYISMCTTSREVACGAITAGCAIL